MPTHVLKYFFICEITNKFISFLLFSLLLLLDLILQTALEQLAVFRWGWERACCCASISNRRRGRRGGGGCRSCWCCTALLFLLFIIFNLVELLLCFEFFLHCLLSLLCCHLSCELHSVLETGFGRFVLSLTLQISSVLLMHNNDIAHQHQQYINSKRQCQ